MKKSKRPPSKGGSTAVETATAPKRALVWWPWVAALAGLFAVFEAYGPAMNGPFVLDDLYLMFANPKAPVVGLSGWIGNIRPLLMFSYWVNYQWAGPEPYIYHATNVFLHFLGSIVVALVSGRLLEFAGVEGKSRAALSVLAGGLFLLHPLQTESVAYVASRSEVLSVLLYMSAFGLFLYRRADSMTLWRALAILVLFGAAISTKEHTLTLAALVLLADYFWGLGGLRKNAILYGLMAAAGAGGAVFVWRVLRDANTAGFRVQGLTPATYFFTQCRVLWMYVRLFFLPFGQNVDPDIPVSSGLFDHGAVFGLLALAGVGAAAWVYRKRFPLAAFGVLMFLLLMAPTSSVVPIRDVLAERRLYLPFLGLTLVCLEFLRRLRMQPIILIGAALLAVCGVLTYKRSAVWGDSLVLWQDTVEKSPQKWRPRFQLAHAYYSIGQCPQAAEHYAATAKLGPTEFPLLVDWGLALDCAGRPYEGIEKLRQAAQMERSAHVQSQIGMIYAKQQKMTEALAALEEAERINPSFEMTYVYRGGVYEIGGDRASAVREYQRALSINPTNQAAREALGRVRP